MLNVYFHYDYYYFFIFFAYFVYDTYNKDYSPHYGRQHKTAKNTSQMTSTNERKYACSATAN